jgi:hypothetical protein
MADPAPIPYEYTPEYYTDKSKAKAAAMGRPSVTMTEAPPAGTVIRDPASVRPDEKEQPVFIQGAPPGYLGPPSTHQWLSDPNEPSGVLPYIRKGAIYANNLAMGVVKPYAALERGAYNVANAVSGGSLGNAIGVGAGYPSGLEPDYVQRTGVFPGLEPQNRGERDVAMAGQMGGAALPFAAFGPIGRGASLAVPTWNAVRNYAKPVIENALSAMGRGGVLGVGIQEAQERGHPQLAQNLEDYGGLALNPGQGRGFVPTGRQAAIATGAGAVAAGVGAMAPEEMVVRGIRGGDAAKSIVDYLHHPGLAGLAGLGATLTGLYGPELMRRINMLPSRFTVPGVAATGVRGAAGMFSGQQVGMPYPPMPENRIGPSGFAPGSTEDYFRGQAPQ